MTLRNRLFTSETFWIITVKKIVDIWHKIYDYWCQVSTVYCDFLDTEKVAHFGPSMSRLTHENAYDIIIMPNAKAFDYQGF